PAAPKCADIWSSPLPHPHPVRCSPSSWGRPLRWGLVIVIVIVVVAQLDLVLVVVAVVVGGNAVGGLVVASAPVADDQGLLAVEAHGLAQVPTHPHRDP